MKVIIAGSREMPESDKCLIPRAVFESEFIITEVVCGMARGADLFGKEWAEAHEIPVKEMRPDYATYGRFVAPKMRNAAMAIYADALIVFIYHNSGGSRDMLKKMNDKRKPFFAVIDGRFP